MALPRRLFEDTTILSLTWLSVPMACLLSLGHGTRLYASGTCKRKITRGYSISVGMVCVLCVYERLICV